MHDGFPTLAQIINHYNVIPGDNTNLDPRLRRPGGVQNLNLSQQQKNDLAAFLARSPAALFTPMKSGPIPSTRKTNSRSSCCRPIRWGSPITGRHGHRRLPSRRRPRLPSGILAGSEGMDSRGGAHRGCRRPLWEARPVSGTRFYRFTYEPPAP